MTAVAPPVSYQSGYSRNSWTDGSGSQIALDAMSSDDVSRIVIPRKSVQRSNSSSSISSTSSTATISSSPSQPNGALNGEANPATRKKPVRGLWPSSKAEPVSGLSTARPQSVPASSAGTSAASAISALHTPSTMGSTNMNGTSQPNGVARGQGVPDGQAMLCLLPMNGTFENKTITVPFHPDILRIGRQTNQKTVPTPINGYFDSKVLSRQHAEIWADRDGKIWIRDIKSSNGTFVNGKRLSLENRDSEPHQLKEQDILELGIDIVSEDGKTIVHHKVAAKVDRAGIYSAPNQGDQGMNIAVGLDSSTAGGQGAGFRSRTTSQGSAANGNRYSGAFTGAVGGYHAKWLQPVTMEQIVKRLNVELRQARLQAQDLSHTSEFVDAVVAHRNPVPPILHSSKRSSPTKSQDVKTRFSGDPPAPPPSQPLPEKPGTPAHPRSLADLHNLQPLLKRSDTERPISEGDGSGAQSDQTQQIVTLTDALKSAQDEIMSQGEKLRNMEDALKREQAARSTAEEQVQKLSTGSSDDHNTTSAERGATEALPQAQQDEHWQERIDLMREEMTSMREQVERYRIRAEAAEQESQKHQQTLVEMVASIRKRDEAAQRRKDLRRKRRESGKEQGEVPTTGNTDAANIDEEEEDDLGILDEIMNAGVSSELNGHIDTVLRRRSPSRKDDAADPSRRMNGVAPSWTLEQIRSLSPAQRKNLSRALQQSLQDINGSAGGVEAGAVAVRTSRAQEQLVQSAPYASIFGVVLFGVAMMSYLNGWQKMSPTPKT